MPLLDANGNLPGRSLAMTPFNAVSSCRWKAVGPTKCWRFRFVRGDGKSSSLVVDRIPWGSRRMRPMMEGIDLGKCLRMSSLVKPGQVAKKPASIAAQKVFGGG